MGHYHAHPLCATVFKIVYCIYSDHRLRFYGQHSEMTIWPPTTGKSPIPGYLGNRHGVASHLSYSSPQDRGPLRDTTKWITESLEERHVVGDEKQLADKTTWAVPQTSSRGRPMMCAFVCFLPGLKVKPLAGQGWGIGGLSPTLYLLIQGLKKGEFWKIMKMHYFSRYPSAAKGIHSKLKTNMLFCFVWENKEWLTLLGLKGTVSSWLEQGMELVSSKFRINTMTKK